MGLNAKELGENCGRLRFQGLPQTIGAAAAVSILWPGTDRCGNGPLLRIISDITHLESERYPLNPTLTRNTLPFLGLTQGNHNKEP